MSEPRVLLVEDDSLDAAVAMRSLKHAGGCSVERCSTLAAALERLAAADLVPPSVVLLDLSLPDCSGVETFDRIAVATQIPIVVMTGDDDPSHALALIERGAQDYLVKGEMSGASIARMVRQAIERARLLGELSEARDQALIAARSQSAFVAAMSHEIRTPLSAILGMADLLAQTALDTDQREYVEIFRRCGRSLKGLLDNALELSRSQSGSIELAAEPFELDALVHECLEAFAFAAHRKGIALVGDVAEAAIGSVVSDEGRLRQVLFNLVGNAVKFTEAGRVAIRVEASTEPDTLAIEIADTGIGIPEDRQAAIFDRFVQAESGTTRRFGGSGLGLALCRELVEAMGGQIAVASAPGEGSRFRVTLPLRVKPRPGGVDYAGRRILLLFADPVERSAAASRLRAHGAQVDEVATAEEAALRLTSDTSFDALLLDARLPGGGGLELLERLDLRDPPALHCVVLLPMDHRVGDLARCAASGAIVFTKPARWDELDPALRDGRRESPRATSAEPSAPWFGGRRILLAEDTPENRTIVLAHLGPTGCAVEVAADGREALAQFRAGSFDLVLMDMHMPRLDGCEATRRIRAFEREAGRRRTPIVALTADALPEQETACLTAGCDAHLAKPFTRGDLHRVFRQFLAEGEPPAPSALAPDAAPRAIPAVAALRETPPELADLAEEYLQNRCRDAEKLRAAASEHAFDIARRLGHNMKGSGAGYGFPRISELGAEIERAAARGDDAAIQRAACALSELAEKVLAALR
jgi:signal transduction histidine kinase